MKTKYLLLTMFLSLACAIQLRAQQNTINIIKDFTSLKDINLTQNFEKETYGEDFGISEVYNFSIKKKNFKYIDGITAAMREDAKHPRCYRSAMYQRGMGTPRQWRLQYGPKADQYYEIGQYSQKNYQFICFADSAPYSSIGKYRKLYCIEWWPIGERRIDGRIIISHTRIPNDNGNSIIGSQINTVADSAIYVGNLKPLKIKSKKSNIQVLQNIQILLGLVRKGQHIQNSTLGVQIYKNISEAIDSKTITDPDELQLIEKQIKDIWEVLRSEVRNNSQLNDIVDYLGLTLKKVRKAIEKARVENDEK